MLVARQSVHSGSVKEFFAPVRCARRAPRATRAERPQYHVALEASAKSEVSAAIVDEQIGCGARRCGNADRVAPH